MTINPTLPALSDDIIDQSFEVVRRSGRFEYFEYSRNMISVRSGTKTIYLYPAAKSLKMGDVQICTQEREFMAALFDCGWEF